MSLSSFEAFLKSLKPHPLIKSELQNDLHIPLDLSIHNSELKGVNISSSNDLEKFIWGYMKAYNAKSAFGGYLEQRGIYERSDYFNRQNSEEERNIHLGLDIWIEANTPIYAPLSGILHSFKNNTNYGDYGPTIILKHSINNFEFYTFYGHLSLASIKDLKVGVDVKQGEHLATLGEAIVNGDYPPHLHFQIIRDIQHFKGDYPGVTNLIDLEFYKQNCPDPNLLLDLV